MLRLQGTMQPAPGDLARGPAGRSRASPLPDHADHVHIGWQPALGAGGEEPQFVQLLKPDQWQRLTKRLGEIDNPEVPTAPSKFSLPDKDRAKADGNSGGSGSGD